MKIEVAKPDLEAALQVVSIGTGSGGSDLTTHYVFRHIEDSNEIQVLSNNNRLGCSMAIQGTNHSLSDDTNAFTVEAKRLNNWLSAVSEGVLTLEVKDGTVHAKGSKGTVRFSSLDPEQFAYWDKTFADAEKGITIQAKRLHAALSHVKQFISDKDTTVPKLAVTECRNGAFHATDKGALALVTLRRQSLDEDGKLKYDEVWPELEEGEERAEDAEPDLVPVMEKEFPDFSLRVHSKDLGPVLSFLNQSGDNEVELREHDRSLFIIRHDGGVMSVGRPRIPFPDVDTTEIMEDDHYWWDLRKDELVSAVKVLVSAAAKEDTRLTFKKTKKGIVSISMSSAAAGKSEVHLEIQDQHTAEDAAELPKGGFPVGYPYLLKLLSLWSGEIVRMGISPQGKSGWARFRQDRDGDDYLTLLVWPD